MTLVFETAMTILQPVIGALFITNTTFSCTARGLLTQTCLLSTFNTSMPNSSGPLYYTCQLFLRYRREIFILGVLGFLKMTRLFLNIPEEVRSLLKKSEVFRRHPKSSEDVSEVCRRRSYRENAYPQGPTLVDNISAIVLKSESFRLTWSIF